LLVHIIKIIVQPQEKRVLSLGKRDLTTEKLREATMVAMNNWLFDEEHPEDAVKRRLLEELFRVARAEEKYKNGEIGKKSPSADGQLMMFFSRFNSSPFRRVSGSTGLRRRPQRL
jgi:hypothetical protein